MALMQYQCNRCHMALDDSQIERHISAQHLYYFPFECAWCKEENQKHFSASKEDMKQHISRNHNGNNSRHLVTKNDSKEDELKKLAKECRRSAIPQIPSIDSKDALHRFCNVLDSAASTASAAEDDPGLTQVKREVDEDINSIEREQTNIPENNESNSVNTIRKSTQSLASTPTDTFAPPYSLSIKNVLDTTCKICHMGPFATTQSLVRHVERKHPNQIDTVKTKYAQTALPFACTICNKSFPIEKSLRMHMRRHNEEEMTHKCPKCPNRAYILASELRKHIKRCHEKKKKEHSDNQEKEEEFQQMDATGGGKNSENVPTKGFEDVRTEIIYLYVHDHDNKDNKCHIICSEIHDDYEVLQTLREKFNDMVETNGTHEFFMPRILGATRIEIEAVLRNFGFNEEFYDAKHDDSDGYRTRYWKFVRTISK